MWDAVFSRSACDLQQVGVDRQGADALGRGGEDRVRHRRADGGGRGLADAAGGLGASDQMCFDDRRLVDPERPIGVKVALLHPPVLERDRAFVFNDTATTEIYTLSLHDALPI